MIPLADRMRPNRLSDIVGQSHILAQDKILFKAIKNNQLFSMIFWGPPGVGKTTLARAIANEIQADFLEFSAVNTGIAEIKKIFESVGKQNRLIRTVIFIDEIHRFSKAQQDAFLPYVENGLITLIGATTENPSFEVIGPLLSRTRVLMLTGLSKGELEEIIKRALSNKDRGLGQYKVVLKKDAQELLIEGSGGDARTLLNTLEIAVLVCSHFGEGVNDRHQNPSEKKILDSGTRQNDKIIITKEMVEEAFQRKSLQYDKGGEEHYNTISAYIKSMRASDVDAALYYLAKMVEAGEDPKFIARRMVIFSSEDIGLAQPTALVVANEVFRAVETIGYPECQINLAHGTAYLAQAKKDRSAYEGYMEALDDVKRFGNLPIPLNLRNAPTKLMKNLGYGKGYKMYPDKDKSLLPEKLKGKKYYQK